MIICTRCGHGNSEEEEFCGSCGAFLEWSGEYLPDDQSTGGQGDTEMATEPVGSTDVIVRHGLISRVVRRARHPHDQLPSPSDGQATAPATVRGLSEPPAGITPAGITPAGITPAGRDGAAGGAAGTTDAGEDAAGTIVDPDAETDEEAEAAAAAASEAASAAARISAQEAARRRIEAARRRSARRSVGERPPGKPLVRHHAGRARDMAALEAGHQAIAVHCMSCGAGNDPARVLCIRCGEPLRPGAVEPAVQPVGEAAEPAEAPAAPGEAAPGEAPAGTAGTAAPAGHKSPLARAKAEWKKFKAKLKKLKAKVKKPKFLKKLKKSSSQGSSSSTQPAGIGARKWSRISAPGGASGGGKLMKVGFVLGALVILLSFVGPFSKTIKSHVTSYASDAKNILRPHYDPVVPVSAAATNSAPGYPPLYAIDNVINTSWETDAPDDGIGQSITIGFAGYQRVDKIGFLSGDQTTPSAFRTEARPHEVAVLWSNGHRGTIDLADVSTFQVFPGHQLHVDWVKLTIKSVYPSATGSRCALAEVEFFKLV